VQVVIAVGRAALGRLLGLLDERLALDGPGRRHLRPRATRRAPAVLVLLAGTRAAEEAPPFRDLRADDGEGDSCRDRGDDEDPSRPGAHF
jgi:hypothetical protein